MGTMHSGTRSTKGNTLKGLTLEDIVETLKEPEIPKGAFTVEDVAAQSGRAATTVNCMLLVHVKAGRLKRVKSGKKWFYFPLSTTGHNT